MSKTYNCIECGVEYQVGWNWANEKLCKNCFDKGLSVRNENEIMDEAGQLASRWKRLWGSIIDGIIGSAIALPVMWMVGVDFTQDQQMSLGQEVFFFFFGLAIFLLVNGYLLAKHGQTVGKKLVGTRIVSKEDQSILSLGRVFGLRFAVVSLIYQIPTIGGLFALADCLFIFRKDKRCIHDLIAGSKVVNE